MILSRRLLVAGAGAAAALFVGAQQASSAASAAPRVDLTRQGLRLFELSTPFGLVAVYEGGRPDGPPLLLLHGISGGASSYHWNRVVGPLGDSFRLLVPDLPGWGASVHPEESLQFEHYVDAIGSFIDDLEPAAIVAESLSCGFAAAALAIHPGSVRSLLMIGPSGARDFGEDQFRPLVRATLGTLAQIPVVDTALYRLVFHRRSTFQSFWEDEGFEHPGDVQSDIVDATWWSATRPLADRSALPFLSGSLRYDIAPLLGGISLPAAMIWNEEDLYIRPATRARLQALNPSIADVRSDQRRGSLLLARPDEVVDFVRTRARVG